MFKNFARFMKNPIGYTWWKVYVKRSPQTLFALTFFAAFAVSWNMYKKVESRHWLIQGLESSRPSSSQDMVSKCMEMALRGTDSETARH